MRNKGVTMQSISVGDFKTDFSEVLSRIQSGEKYIIDTHIFIMVTF